MALDPKTEAHVQNPPFYTTAAFAVLIASVAVTLFIAGAIILLYLAKLPESAIAAAVGILISIAGPLVAALILILRQQFNVDVAIQSAKLLDGHLLAHTQPDGTGTAPPAPAS